MKNYELIIRRGVMLIVILLGLTAVFPEWLDLKDLIFADYKMRILEAELSGRELAAEGGFDFFDSVLTYIHQTILSELPNRPSGGYILHGLFQFIWQIASFALYVIFLAFFILIFSLNFTMIERKINISELPLSGRAGLGGGLLVLSFALSLFIWPYVTAIATAVFLYLFYVLEWLFSLAN